MELFKRKIYEFTNIINKKKSKQFLKNKNIIIRNKTPINSVINSTKISKIINVKRKENSYKILIIKKIMNNNLKKHNSTISFYNKGKITSLIFDGKFHYVSLFKDYLFWDDEVECLKQYYNKKESIIILKKFINYYNTIYNSLNIYCIFFHLGDCNNALFNYYSQKIRLQKSIVENFNNNNLNEKKNESIEKYYSEKNEKMINIHSQLTSISFNLSELKNNEFNETNNENIIHTTKSSKIILKTRNDEFLTEKEKKIKESNDETIKFLVKNLTHKKKTNKIYIYKYNNKKKDILNIHNIDKIRKALMKISPLKENKKLKKNSSSINKKINKNSINFLNIKAKSNNNSLKKLYVNTESSKILINKNKNKIIYNLKTFNEKSPNLKNNKNKCLTERNFSKNKKKTNRVDFQKFKPKIFNQIKRIYYSTRTSPQKVNKSVNKIIYFNKNYSKKAITNNNSQSSYLKTENKKENIKKMNLKSKIKI